MKKHEACYHLNNIRMDLQEQLARRDQEGDIETIRDFATNTTRPATEKEIADQRRWNKEAVANLAAKIEALDIAGDALTR